MSARWMALHRPSVLKPGSVNRDPLQLQTESTSSVPWDREVWFELAIASIVKDKVAPGARECP
ncbi:MAG: hypothetical protein U0T81_10290 [Saprospiraceae bacterium]